MIGWASRLFEALAPHAAPGRYVNYLDAREDGTAESSGDTSSPPSRAVRDAYGSHYERLAEIKARWDPENVFRVNHNIRPAPSTAPATD
jgi:hypothetical protein